MRQALQMLASLRSGLPAGRAGVSPAFSMARFTASRSGVMAGRSLRGYAVVSRSELKPTEQVPDVESFLSQIGRNMVQYKDNFESWEQLVQASSTELKDKGIDTRDRRYLLNWLHKYGMGQPLEEIKRGEKKWGGERNRRAQRAAHYGRLRAEKA